MSLTRYQSMQIKRFQTPFINIILYEYYCLDEKLSLCMLQFLEKYQFYQKSIYLEGIIKISTNFYAALVLFRYNIFGNIKYLLFSYNLILVSLIHIRITTLNSFE